MIVPFMYNFRSLSNKLPTNFWSLVFFLFHYPGRLGYFSKKKETYNLRIKKCDGEGNRKNHPFRDKTY